MRETDGARRLPALPRAVRAAAGGEEGGDQEERGREEGGEEEQNGEAAAGGGGGAAGGYDGHACVVPRHGLKRCFIKDEVQTRMSAEPESKKQKREPRDNIVVVSNMGDRRPEEIVPDTVATFCLNHGFSVTSYVCVPGLGIVRSFWRTTPMIQGNGM